MKRNQVRARMQCLAAATMVVGVIPAVYAANAGSTALPANTRVMDVMVTNRLAHFYTNVVEVRVPYNVFRDEFQTNWVETYRTNIVEVYKTNWLSRSLTNVLTVDRVQTNWINAFRTNVYALTLTNWETVVVLKTNWVTQSVTNAVEMSLPAVTSAAAGPVAVREIKPAAAEPGAQTVGQSRGLRIELSRTALPLANNKVEVQFELRSDSDATLRVQEWQLARPDRTVLMLGQRLKFTTELAPGNYRVQVKARTDDNAPWMSVKGALEIGENGVVRAMPEIALNTKP